MLKKWLPVLILGFVGFSALAENQCDQPFEDKTMEWGLPIKQPATAVLPFDLIGDGMTDLVFLNHGFSAGVQTSISVYMRKRNTLITAKEPESKKFVLVPSQGLPLGIGDSFKLVRGLMNPKKIYAIVIDRPKSNDRETHRGLLLYEVTVSPKMISFKEVPGVFPRIEGWVTDFSLGDLDGDNIPEIVVSRHYHLPYDQAYRGGDFRADQSLILKRFGDKYVDVAYKWGLTSTSDDPQKDPKSPTPAQAVSLCDIDGDGKMDILLPAYGRRWNKLYLNHSGWFEGQHFEDAAFDLGFEGTSPRKFRGNGNNFGSICGDANNDGKIDVFQGTITHDWDYGADWSAMLWNQYPKPFVRDTNLDRPTDFSNQGDLSGHFGDIDLKGFQDLMIGDAEYPPETRLVMLENLKNGKWKNHSDWFYPAVVNATSPTFVDIDGDGDLDVVTASSGNRGNTQAALRLFINHTLESKCAKGTWLEVNLFDSKGKFGGEIPYGAVVKLYRTGKISERKFLGMRELAFSYFANGQFPSTLHFGISTEDAKSANRDGFELEVRWTDGEISRYPVRLGQIKNIRR